MGSIGKGLAIGLILVMAISSVELMMAKPVCAQSVPTPSVPQFTVKFVDSSYDAPTTTSTNQYNGQTTTNPGYHVENRTIQITIKNQPFTSYIQNGENISFYYNVKEKGQYATNWTTLYSPGYYFPTESNTGYTTLVYLIDANEPPFWDNLVNGGTVDFQVQAMIGSVHRISNITAGNELPWEMFPWIFDGQTSDWSPTQTVTVPSSSPSPSQPPTVTEFPVLVIVPLLLSVFSVAMIVRRRKQVKKFN
ncbi:MAG: hypothetical protein ABSG33_03995 [Candidatus Bathyarchaeia archaeon]|jgi:hypothetical protein